MNTEGRLGTTLFYGLLFGIALMPLLFSMVPGWAQGVVFAWISVLAVVACLGVAMNLLDCRPVFKGCHTLHACFVAFMGWQLWQYQQPGLADEYQVLRGILLTAGYYVVFCLVMLLVNRQKRIEQLLWLIMLLGLFEALYGIFLVVMGLEARLFGEAANNRVNGTFTTADTLAGYFQVTLACGLGLLFSQLRDTQLLTARQRLGLFLQDIFTRKALLRVLLGITVIGLVMTYSRMGNAAFFTSMALVSLYFILVKKRFSRGAMVLIASILLVDTLIVGQWYGLDRLMERITSTVVTVEKSQQAEQGYRVSSEESREGVWRESLPMMEDYWQTGAGFNNFYTLFPSYQQGKSYLFYSHAHNDYIELIIAFGMPGLVLLACMVLRGIFSAALALKESNRPEVIAASFASLAGLLAMLIHPVTDFNLYIPANAAAYCILLALACKARQLCKEAQ